MLVSMVFPIAWKEQDDVCRPDRHGAPAQGLALQEVRLTVQNAAVVPFHQSIMFLAILEEAQTEQLRL